MSDMIPGMGGIGIGEIGAGRGVIRGTAAADGPSFADTFKQALGQVSAVQDDAAQKVNAFVSGDPSVELHQVMAATEEAGIALEMLVEVRNKVLEAWQSLSTMQS
ncbi:flagellar hook-basal body complex protein FliE [Longimicrobium sp.]|uniref:flagellar hook-basal body complex protein FliE n=1 Tax=Longimicrobium sp. TaxID=2029185 RepID=UPI002E333F97|nr:flagellar hook-basal body complex protein FliE [Longimicrobium sp.]HEX6039392.1 flagellar hook-basal body complex protein FliE [Longimicrobium sp.]